jgi:ABC-type uncharacterized transport system substrate-binding protein
MSTRQFRRQSCKRSTQPQQWLLRFAAFILLAIGAFCVHAQPDADAPASGPLVYLASSGRPALDNQVSELLKEKLGPNAIIRPFEAGRTGQDPETPVVTIGSEALSQVRQESRHVPVISLLARPALLDSWASRQETNVTGIYRGAPLLYQALAGKIILPHSTRVAMMATQDSAVIYEDLIDRLPDFGMEGRLFIVSDSNDLIRTLNRALRYGDFLLAAPDSDIYNPRTIKHILLTAYRRNRIVIGPDQAYVSAGSLAAVYAPLDAMISKAAGYIQMLGQDQTLPAADYADRFAVRVNRQVAQSLNIVVPDDKQIIEDLRELTGHSGEPRHD